jgi:hypothetical protein
MELLIFSNIFKEDNMSGFSDSSGNWFEQCNGCGNYTSITRLHTEQPSPVHPVGRSLCSKCKREAAHWITELKNTKIDVSDPRDAKGFKPSEVMLDVCYLRIIELFPTLEVGKMLEYFVYYGNSKFPIPVYALRTETTVYFCRRVIPVF